MPTFQDLDEFLDSTLALPISGNTYTIQSPDAQTGLRVQQIVDAAERAAEADRNADKDKPTEMSESDRRLMTDSEELDLYPDLLGDAYDEMIDDGIPWVKLRFAATTVMMWTAYGEDVAAEYWQAGGKAPAANREQRRAKTTRTAAATTTKRRASGSGTSTRPKPSASKRKAGA